MHEDDPETRIAELERKVAEQRRISELEHQLADATSSTIADRGVEPPRHFADTRTATAHTFVIAHQRCPQDFGGIGPQPGLARERGAEGQTWIDRPRSRNVIRANVSKYIAPTVGACIGAAAALIAVFPSTALWMSGLVCQSSYTLEYGTSHYSYKPGQHGTLVSFHCVSDTRSYEPNDLIITGLQALLVTVVVCAAIGLAHLLWRLLRKPR
jgi:hypothetical protein